MVTNLTKKKIKDIQIDEALVFINYGTAKSQILGPTRGGGEFVATATVRPIEFDGRRGKTAGMEVIEEQAASIKLTTLCMSQEDLARAIPNCVVEDDEGQTIQNPESGVVSDDSYIENITVFAKLLGGAYKKITVFNAMHESGISTKAVQKAEGELGLEFHAHYPKSDLNGKGKLWKVENVKTAPEQPKDTEAQAASVEPEEQTTGDEPESTTQE